MYKDMGLTAGQNRKELPLRSAEDESVLSHGSPQVRAQSRMFPFFQIPIYSGIHVIHQFHLPLILLLHCIRIQSTFFQMEERRFNPTLYLNRLLDDGGGDDGGGGGGDVPLCSKSYLREHKFSDRGDDSTNFDPT